MIDEPRMGIGGNFPPSDPEILVEYLSEKNDEILSRCDDLCKALDRLPQSCTTEEESKKLTTFGGQIKSCLNALESKRKEEKKPYDDLGKTVHAFFNGKMSVLEDGVIRVKSLVQQYMNLENERLRKEAEEKRKAEEAEAARMREEAERLAREAQDLSEAGFNNVAEKTLNAAIDVEQTAQQVLQTAEKTVAEKAIVRSDYGSSASQQTRWKGEIVDVNTVDLESLRQYFGIDSLQKALNAYIRAMSKNVKAGEEIKQISGTRIFRETSISLRG